MHQSLLNSGRIRTLVNVRPRKREDTGLQEDTLRLSVKPLPPFDIVVYVSVCPTKRLLEMHGSEADFQRA